MSQPSKFQGMAPKPFSFLKTKEQTYLNLKQKSKYNEQINRNINLFNY